MEESLMMLFRIREQYVGCADFVELATALTMAGELLVELGESDQRAPDLIGIQDSQVSSQFVELIWEGVNPPSESTRRDIVTIHSFDHVDFKVYHDENLTAFFSETFEGFLQLIREMRMEMVGELTVGQYLN